MSGRRIEAKQPGPPDTGRRWYISLNLKPHPRCRDRWGRAAYAKVCWPILFRSYAEAEAYGLQQRVFRHPDGRAWPAETPDGQRIISWTVESTKIRVREAAA